MHEILGFILPVFAASAEAMIWVLIIVILIVIGRGKILPSEKPLIIERTGQYRMNLAAGLNLAQPFIESIASGLVLPDKHHDEMLRFEVRDKNVASRKQPFYLLEVRLQDGYLNFDASHAQPAHAPSAKGGNQASEIETSIQAAAKLQGISLCRVH